MRISFAIPKTSYGKNPLCCEHTNVVLFELYDTKKNTKKDGKIFAQVVNSTIDAQGNYFFTFVYDETQITGRTLQVCDIKAVRCYEAPKKALADGTIVIGRTLPVDCDEVKKCETVTTLVNNGDGTITYTNEVGNETTFSTGLVEEGEDPIIFTVRGTAVGDAPQVLNPGDVLTLKGQNFISTKAVATDTIEISIDSSGGSANKVFGFDPGGILGWIEPLVFTEGCGLTGSGTCHDPLGLNLPTPLANGHGLACVSTSGNPVYCDTNGQLRVAPDQKVMTERVAYCEEINTNIATGAMNTLMTTGFELTTVMTNPDLCREMVIYGEYLGGGTVRLESGQNIDYQAHCSVNGSPYTLCNTNAYHWLNSDFQRALSIRVPLLVTIPAGGSITLGYKNYIKYNEAHTYSGWARWVNDCGSLVYIGISR